MNACSPWCGGCGRCEDSHNRVIERHCIKCEAVVLFQEEDEPHMPVWCPKCESEHREMLARVASAS